MAEIAVGVQAPILLMYLQSNQHKNDGVICNAVIMLRESALRCSQRQHSSYLRERNNDLRIALG